jgi:hypothetical protein
MCFLDQGCREGSKGTGCRHGVGGECSGDIMKEKGIKGRVFKGESDVARRDMDNDHVGYIQGGKSVPDDLNGHRAGVNDRYRRASFRKSRRRGAEAGVEAEHRAR